MLSRYVTLLLTTYYLLLKELPLPPMRPACQFIALWMLVCGCGQQQMAMPSRAQLQKKADSAAKERLELLDRQYDEDLGKRIPIEVKPKADSLVEAWRAGTVLPADTVQPPNTPQPPVSQLPPNLPKALPPLKSRKPAMPTAEP